jgi:hypothetical protein
MLVDDLFSIALTPMVVEKVFFFFLIFDPSFGICPRNSQEKDKPIHAHQCNGEGNSLLAKN